MRNEFAGSAPAPERKPRFIYLLNLAQRSLQAALHDDAGKQNSARAGILFAVGDDDSGRPTKELRAQLRLSPSALSGLLDRMSRDGLVERRPDPHDGRAATIVLTAEGRAARAEAVRTARTINNRLCEGFDASELALVERWLETVTTRFSPGEKNDE